MPIAAKYLSPFLENRIYHVYNRTNNKEHLFRKQDNYLFFLEKYDHYLSPFIDTFCWNLLPDHFHLGIRVKSEESILAGLRLKNFNQLSKTENLFINNQTTLNHLVVKSFTRFFQSYAQSFNQSFSRNGNLFYKPFKRIEINKDSQLTSTMVYIHANALKHGLVKDFRDHKWSSWHTILSSKPTKLLRNQAINWFGNIDVFTKAHLELSNFYYNNEIGDIEA